MTVLFGYTLIQSPESVTDIRYNKNIGDKKGPLTRSIVIFGLYGV